MDYPNLLDPKTFDKNPLFIRPGETPDAYSARVAALNPQATPKPAIPAPVTSPSPSAIDYASIAKNAGTAGLGASDLGSLFGPSAEEDRATKDALAKEFGYDNYAAFTSDLSRKPSKTTEDFYHQAYSGAGLDELLRQMDTKKQDLLRATGVINDNPWLDEASRTGKVGRLNELANADIKNLNDLYTLKLGKVHDLVTAHANDLGSDERLRTARLTYLENAAKERATQLGLERARNYLGDYATGKTNAGVPKTITVPDGSAVYQWNEATKSYDLIRAATPKKDGLTLYQQFQATNDLQKQLMRYTQGARDMQRQYNVMKDAYDRLDRGDARDLNATSQAIISTFNKIIDPSSVVRESEYARSPEGQSLLDALSGRVSALSQGGPGLTKESLKEFVDLAKVFVDNSQQSLQAANAQAIATAQAFGLNTSLVGVPGASAPAPAADLPSMIDEALKNNYSPDEILTYLSSTDPALKQKIDEARSNQYPPDQILNFLKSSGTPAGNPAQRNNNPGNIKVTPTSLKAFADLGATASSTTATDGGSFLQFPTPEAGFEAVRRLLKSGIYSGLRVGAALKKWSNNGYGDNVALAANVDPNALVRDLPPDQLDRLVDQIAQAEGFYQ